MAKAGVAVVCAGMLAGLCAGALAADDPIASDPFCVDLHRVLAAAPLFIPLRGAQEGSEFSGNLLLEGAQQCELRNKSELGMDPDSPQGKWTYECLWENRTEDAMEAMTEVVGLCLPGAPYAAGSEFKDESFGSDYAGGIYTVGVNRISVDLNKTTGQLWLVVLPPGVND